MASKIRSAVKAYAVNPAIKGLPKPVAPVKGLPRVPVPAGPPKGLTPVQQAAAPSASPMPWDANYENVVGGINRDRDTSVASIDQQTAAAKQAYGFDDLSDPFSKIALLKETFANSQRGNTNSLAAQGQLYSGALQNAQDATQHGYDVNYDATRRDYDAVLADLQTRRTGALNKATDDTAAADWARTQTALANRPDPATLPAPAKPAPAKPNPAAAAAAARAKAEAAHQAAINAAKKAKR